jgi:large subunit ribosomal protein L18
MRNQVIKKQTLRKKRAMRVRKRFHGSAERPRLSVYKSHKHIVAQLINDDAGTTLAMIGTNSRQFRGTPFEKKNVETAKKIGEAIADAALKNNVHEAVFDRGPFMYHGILKAIADAAREKGLKI